jgi:membrane protease YdiL (CAAX protease family)
MLGALSRGIVHHMARWSFVVIVVASSGWAFPDPLRAPRVLRVNGQWALESSADSVPPLLAAPLDVELVDAAILGAEPARWEVAVVYLLGLNGTAVDTAWGEALTSFAPPAARPRLDLAIGQALFVRDEARALTHLKLALEARVPGAQHTVCFLSRGAIRVKRLDAAERALALARAAPPLRSPYCHLAEAKLAERHRRWQDVWTHANALEVATKGRPEWEDEYRMALALRILAAAQTGRLASMTAADLDGLLRPIIDRVPAIRWAVYGGGFFAALALLGWTWRTRAKPIGLWLALTWTCVPLFANGMGILLPPGLPFGPTVDRWSGAFAGAALSLMGLALRRTALPFGASTLRFGWREVAPLIGLLVAVQLIGELHGKAYEALFGVPLESQLIATLLKVDGGGARLVTLLAAALAIPYAEEVAFRGFLFEGFAARWGGRVAVIATALLFAFAHLEPVQPFSKVPLILVMGFALGLLRHRSGHLGPSVALHAMNNALATMALWWWE